MAGAIPFLVLNHFLLYYVLQVDYTWEAAIEQPQEVIDAVMGYLFWMVCLVAMETPLVTAPLTLYLGEAMFVERPSASRIVGRLFKSAPQLLGLQVVMRGMLFGFCCLPVMVMYLVFPYLNEIVLLERNTLGKTFRRVQDLHSSHLGLIFNRWLSSLVLGVFFLIPSLWLSLLTLRNLFVDQWEWETLGYTLGLYVEVPLAVWLVVGLFTVVRFLSYLDLRIRREGWEIELQMRAQAAQLVNQVHVG